MSEEKRKSADSMMKEMEKRLNENKDLNENWGKSIQVIYTDIETCYNLKFAMDGSVQIEKKPVSSIKLEDAAASIYCTVDDIRDIIDGKMSAIEAMSSGKFRIEGPLEALMKLSPAIL